MVLRPKYYCVDWAQYSAYHVPNIEEHLGVNLFLHYHGCAVERGRDICDSNTGSIFALAKLQIYTIDGAIFQPFILFFCAATLNSYSMLRGYFCTFAVND